MTDVTLADILNELTSLIIHQKQKMQTEEELRISVGIEIFDSFGKENTHSCALKVSTNCLLPVVDLLKDGHGSKLTRFANDMQRKRNGNVFLVKTSSDILACNDAGSAASSTVFQLEAVSEGGVIVTAQHGADLFPGTKEDYDSIHIHLRLHRKIEVILAEAKIMHDFLRHLRFLQPSAIGLFTIKFRCLKLKLSFTTVLHPTNQISRDDFRYNQVTKIKEFSVITDPRYYVPRAPAESVVYLGMGENYFCQRNLRVTCLACHVVHGMKKHTPMKADGIVSALAYDACGVPVMPDISDWGHRNWLLMVPWQTFGFAAKPADHTGSSRSSMVCVCKLSMEDASLLPGWAKGGEFMLRLSFVFAWADDNEADKERELCLKQLHWDNVPDLSDTATKALRNLYLESRQDNHENQCMHEVFLPMVAASVASIYRRSINPGFRDAVEDCLEVCSGLAVEARLRDCLEKVVGKDCCRRAECRGGSAPSLPQSHDMIDVWEDYTEDEEHNDAPDHSAVNEESTLDEDTWC